MDFKKTLKNFQRKIFLCQKSKRFFSIFVAMIIATLFLASFAIADDANGDEKFEDEKFEDDLYEDIKDLEDEVFEELEELKDLEEEDQKLHDDLEKLEEDLKEELEKIDEELHDEFKEIDDDLKKELEDIEEDLKEELKELDEEKREELEHLLDEVIDDSHFDDGMLDGSIILSEHEINQLQEDAKMCAIELGRKDDLIMGQDARITELVAFIEEQGLEVPEESDEVKALIDTSEFDELMDVAPEDLVEEAEADVENSEPTGLLKRFFGFFAPQDGEAPLDEQIIAE